MLARDPSRVKDITSLPNNGPASRCQRTGGRGIRAMVPISVRTDRSATELQPARKASFIAGGTRLCSGEQVSWYTAERVPPGRVAEAM